ncbi:MAG: hypothetical protein AAB759_03205 [Patescibacteria group bacterium]
MFHPSRRIKIFIALIVVVLGGYIANSRLGFSSNGVPADFKEARLQGGVIAQDIVNISNRMSQELAMINKLDGEGNLAEALNQTTALLRETDAVKNRAVELSTELEKMTGALATIKSPEARTAALESISNRLALISRLLSYNTYLIQLLTTLRDRFTGMPTNMKVATIIAQINAEVNAINNFNREAGQAMDRFDRIIQN